MPLFNSLLALKIITSSIWICSIYWHRYIQFSVFQLLPLLVQSLNSQQVAVWLSTLSTLSDLIAEMPDIFSRHIDDFLPRLLDLTQYRPDMVGHVKIFILSKHFMIMGVRAIGRKSLNSTFS